MIQLEHDNAREFGVITPLPRTSNCPQLPTFVSAGDIRELVQYLENKPNGVTVSAELDRVKRRLFEEKKLTAFEILGFIEFRDGSVGLSPLGLKFAGDLEAEERLFRYILKRILPYCTALEWIHQQKLELATATDILGYWREFYTDTLDLSDPEAMRGAIVPFFTLCQAAVLGTMTLGKRGHTTRLCIDQYELARFLESAGDPILEADPSGSTQPRDFWSTGRPLGQVIDLASLRRPVLLKALILQSSSRNSRILELVRQTLDLVHGQSGTVEMAWNGKADFGSAIEGPNREYNALLVILDEESFIQIDADEYRLKERVLMEIGAAHVLYDGRVILLADRRFKPPFEIQELIYYEFENNSVDWDVGLKLIGVLENFKSRIAESRRLARAT